MKLPRRSTSCCQCQAAFEEGGMYISQVVGEERSDFCPNCWKGEGTFWQGKIPLRKERSPDEKALNLFRNREEFRYLLALYLVRRKELAERAQLSKGDLRCYEILETGELFHVKVGALKQEALAAVDAELS